MEGLRLKMTIHPFCDKFRTFNRSFARSGLAELYDDRSYGTAEAEQYAKTQNFHLFARARAGSCLFWPGYAITS